MSDLAGLHRRLRRALDVSTLIGLSALVPGCTATQGGEKAEKAKTEKPDERKQVTPDPVPPPNDDGEAPTTAIHPEPELFEPPGCPTGNWCGPKALIEPLKRKDGSVADAHGCPGSLQGGNEIDAKPFEGHEGLPLNGAMVATVDPIKTAAEQKVSADICCYSWTELCPGGRPLMVDGRPVVAGVRDGSEWIGEVPEFDLGPLTETMRNRIGEEWLRDALTEHASIFSFLRARAELEQIGAPAELLAEYLRAADDEIEHARVCFALAERYGGRAIEPDQIPGHATRAANAVQIAFDTFVEGCVGETVAAACARRAAELTDNPIVRAVLERIAMDETEHAALAWRTVAYLVHREGPAVLDAIRTGAAVWSAPGRVEPEPDAPTLHAHGRLDLAELARTRADVLRLVIEPLLAELERTRPAPRWTRQAVAWPTASA